MRVCGLGEAVRLASLLVLVIIVIVVVDRTQEMGEGPLGHVAPLLPRLHVRKAKVDTLVDTGIDYVRGGIRKAVIPAHPLEGRRVCGGCGKGHFVRPKEEGEGTGCGTGDVVSSGG